MRANSKALDIPHVLSISATYELPFGEGQRLMSSGLGSMLRGGWSVSRDHELPQG